MVVDRNDPYTWVAVSGPAELVDEGAEEHLHELSRRYTGEDYTLVDGERRVIDADHAGARHPAVTGVLLCDVGPRDGLQNEPVVLAPAVRAELVNRLAAAGLRRIEAVSFVRDDARAGDGRGGGGRRRDRAARGRRDGGARAERARVVAARGDARSTASTSRSRRRRRSTGGTATRRWRRRRPRGADSRAGRPAGHGHDLGRVRLPVRGAGRSGRRGRPGRAVRGRRGRAGGHDRRGDAARGARARGAHRRCRVPRSQHA